jgi:glycosyltransferase involved in cell wall biosynthesis
MKIILDCHVPALLAHGGVQIQIEQTHRALLAGGVNAEFMRWWDAGQTGDLIHFFGRMPAYQIRFARQKGLKVVMADLLTAAGSQNRAQRLVRRTFRRLAETLAPPSLTAAFQWETYRLADACVAVTAWEKHLMEYRFGADPQKVFVVPNGVEEVFFQSPKTARGEWLVCTATITERKRVLELAQAAVAARTPVWIIGQAYAEKDGYAQKFFALAKAHPQFIRYEGGISDRAALAKIYRAARGFVLLSAMESLSLSALEAAACECPLLLSDLPWARGAFGAAAAYAPAAGGPGPTAAILKKFYATAPALPAPRVRLFRWPEVAQALKKVYENVLGGGTH